MDRRVPRTLIQAFIGFSSMLDPDQDAPRIACDSLNGLESALNRSETF